MENDFVTGNLKILLLEDSFRDFELISEQLTDAGFFLDMTHAENESEFSSALQNDQFDIILSDFRLPGFNAFGALTIRNETCPDVPFICVSGSIGEETAIELLKQGAVDYVLKDRPERLPFAVKLALKDAREKSAHLQAEEALRISEEKFRSIFHHNSAIKLIIDPSDGNIVEANQAAADFYGWPVEKLQEMNFYQFTSITPEAPKAEIEKLIDLKKLHFELTNRKANGSLVDVEVFNSSLFIGNRQFLHFIVHDISEKKNADKQIMLLNRAIESSSVSITITDVEGKIIYVNPYFLDTSGFTRDEVIGNNPRFLNSGHQSKEFYKNLWDTILSGHDWEGEFRNRKKNGELFWEKAVISPIVNNEGVVTNFVAIKENVTDRKKMVEELVAAKEKAEESDKLKTAFINNISHEIRTPLNGILGFGQFLSESELTPEERNEYFALVEKSSKRLMNTVSDYLDMAMIVSGTMEMRKKAFVLRPFFEEIIETPIIQCAEKKLDFEAVIPADHKNIIVNSDQEFIRKLAGILLDNAVKFTEKGKITCGFRIIPAYLEFFVEDTGKGIARDKLEMIFEMFSQEFNSISRGYEGSGLGLAIAKGLVELLGGTITVTSLKGKGSTFTFTIPHSEPAIIENPVMLKKDESGTKPFVLIAEDERSNYLYMEVMMRMTGCDYLHAVNGAEAVDLCRKHPEITLVLMDIKMPVLNGIEATKLIREFRPELPIIATTAYAQTSDEQRFLNAGCNDYLAKPIKKEKLLLLLQKYINI
jgi:PAS domain S-box-containing protein